MKEYGLIGFPLGHSFSKRFFSEKFQREGIEACYNNFEISEIGALRDIVNAHPNLVGLNCTIPHKEAVVPLLDELSDEGREIGAVNVIKILHENPDNIEGGKIKLIGFNSDTIGFTNSILPLLKPHHKQALILGTGGASKAIEYSLKKLDIDCIFVSRRPIEDGLTYGELTKENIRDYQIIVNCSPVGMHPHEDEAPAIPYEELDGRHLLYDLVYNPEETLFLKRGRLQGATTKNGLEMLELQAIASWDIWQDESIG